MADDRVPYHFCRKCKSTLLSGRVFALKPWQIHGKYGGAA